MKIDNNTKIQLLTFVNYEVKKGGYYFIDKYKSHIEDYCPNCSYTDLFELVDKVESYKMQVEVVYRPERDHLLLNRPYCCRIFNDDSTMICSYSKRREDAILKSIIKFVKKLNGE
jgi:hypothetical protein